MAKNAFITGANKGIGYEVARELSAKGLVVFLGARNATAGQAAVDAIIKEGGNAMFIQIDVSDDASVVEAARAIAKETDRLDVLVNNAGILLKEDISILEETALLRKTLETNTFGPLRVTQAFLPLLKKAEAPCVVHVSSGGGQLDGGADGWAPAYCISKTALNGVTSQLAHALPAFSINSVCPGWVATDMGGKQAPRSLAQGADTIVWLATEAPRSLTGKFLRDRAEIPW